MCFTIKAKTLCFLLLFSLVHHNFSASASHHRRRYLLRQSTVLDQSSSDSGLLTSSRAAHVATLWRQHQEPRTLDASSKDAVSSASSSAVSSSSSTYYFTSFDPVFNETHHTVLHSSAGGAASMQQLPFQLGPHSPIEPRQRERQQSTSTSVPNVNSSTTSFYSTPPSLWPSFPSFSDRFTTTTAAKVEGGTVVASSSSFTIPVERNDSQIVVVNEVSDDGDDSIRIEYRDLTQLSYVQLIFLLLYYPVMIFAVIGNLLVCYSVMSNRKMQTVVNWYIFNLGLCDFLVGCFVLPSKMLELLVDNSWYLLSNRLCMAMFFFQTIVVFASVLTLVATCFERYFAIVHPLKSRMHQSKRRTCRILVAVWLLAAVGSAPNFFSAPQAHDYLLSSDLGSISRRSCIPQFTRQQRVAYFTALFIAFYLVPLLLIAFTCFCIARSLLRTSVLRRQGSLLRQEVNRRKVGKMILIVVLSFTVSWTPYFLVSIITQYQERNFMRDHDFYFTMLCINLFAFLHSAVNPLIYATMSTRFRKSFMRVLRMAVCCQTTPPNGGMAIGHTSFNDQATSSRGSNGMINVNVSVHPARLVGLLPPPPSYRAAMANGTSNGVDGKRSSFEAFKLSSFVGGSWKSRRQSSSSYSSSSVAAVNQPRNNFYLKNSCGTTGSESNDQVCSSSTQAMLMREMIVNGNGKHQRRSLADP